MSDARALLRAKRQEVRVSHPLATYTSSGQLRCIACGTAVKQASAWEGHVGSKAHRVAVMRMREEERRRWEEEQREKARQEEEERTRGKRKAGSADTAEEDAEEDEREEDASREVTREAKRMRLGENAGNGDGDGDDEDGATTLSARTKRKHADGGFPADFFSDPSKAPPALLSDEDEDEEMQQQDGAQPQTQPQAQAAPASAIDAEWAAFEQEVLDHPDERETYERATVFAEPELVDQTVGLPSATEDGAETQTKPELTEEDLRQRKQQEERELIMDRLLDEERAQEEADAKVAMLKNKLEALRSQRQARKAMQRKSDP